MEKNQLSLKDFWLNKLEWTKKEKELFNNYPKEKELDNFSQKPFVFGTSGIRRVVGVSPQEWNIYTYRLAAYGYGKYILSKGVIKPSVIIAHDNRPNSKLFSYEVAKTLSHMGIIVYLNANNESLPTPLVSYLIIKNKLLGGINITASHNPLNYNGFKAYRYDGVQVNEKDEETILNNIPDNYEEVLNIAGNENKIKYLPDDEIWDYLSQLNEYLNLLEDLPSKHKEFKVLFSSHHGTSTNIMTQYAQKSGFINFQDYPPECDLSVFSNPEEILNPEDIESFSKSTEYANINNFEYQISHDPDSDRSSILEKQFDGSWKMFSGNEIAILLVDFLSNLQQSHNNLYIVSTYVSNNYVFRMCKYRNINIVLTNTGFKNISKIVEAEEKKKNHLLLAFEEAIGCLLFPIHREKDAFQQTIVLLNIIAKCKTINMRLSDYLYGINKLYGFFIGITKYYILDKSNFKSESQVLIDKLLKHNITPLFNYEIQKIEFNELSSSVWFIFEEDNWIQFRASGTEPKFKIYYNLYIKEGENKEILINQFYDYFKKYLFESN